VGKYFGILTEFLLSYRGLIVHS